MPKGKCNGFTGMLQMNQPLTSNDYLNISLTFANNFAVNATIIY